MIDILLTILAVVGLIGGMLLISLLLEGFEASKWSRKQKAFAVAWGQGFFDGWVARHYGQQLEETRPTPEELRQANPSLLETPDTIAWKWEYDHMTMREFRQMQINKLNEELRHDSPKHRDSHLKATLVKDDNRPDEKAR